MKKFIVFDLDGTLIDTLSGITVAVNEYLKNKDLPYHYSKDEVETFIGEGAVVLFKKMIKNEVFKEEDYEYFLSLYLKEQYSSKPFKYVVETLNELVSLKYKLLIYSNKPDELLKPLVNKVFPSIPFLIVQGQDSRYKCKPDATLLNLILKKFGLSPFDGYYVGDTYIDVLTGKNAKLKTIVVKGYGDIKKAKECGSDSIIDDFSQLIGVIKVL